VIEVTSLPLNTAAIDFIPAIHSVQFGIEVLSITIVHFMWHCHTFNRTTYNNSGLANSRSEWRRGSDLWSLRFSWTKILTVLVAGGHFTEDYRNGTFHSTSTSQSSQTMT